MANTINYAEKWQRELLRTLAEPMYTAKFMTTNVNWLDAKTFHFSTMATGGFGNHSRAGGWNASVITQADVPFTLTHDRDVELQIDKADVDESNQTATIQNISSVFLAEHAGPEADAYFYEKVAGEAIDASLYADESYSASDIYTKIKNAINAVRRYRKNIEIHISPDAMNALELSSQLTRKIEYTQVAPGGLALEARVTAIDGVSIIEVDDIERFNTVVYYRANTNAGEDGFTGDIAESSQINFIVVDREKCKTVPKISSIYFFAPGQHTKGDGYLYQNRSYWDTFVFPDGTKGVKSVYVSFNSESLTVTSAEGTASGDTLITLDKEILNSGYTYVYKTDTTVTLPEYGDDLSTWTAWNGTDDITATTGEEIAIAVVDGSTLAVTSGKTTVVSKA